MTDGTGTERTESLRGPAPEASARAATDAPLVVASFPCVLPDLGPALLGDAGAPTTSAEEAPVRRPLLIALAALAIVPTVAPAAEAAATRWSGNGHLYEVRFDPRGVSWVQALLRAQALGCGWYLATITSAAEGAFVFGLAARRPEVFDAQGGSGPWLGAFQANPRDEPAGNWRWVTDEPFAYTNWDPGEPNDSGGVETFMNSYRSGTWNDAKSIDVLKGFVVEFDAARQRSCRRRG